jgi:hypothetical protein
VIAKAPDPFRRHEFPNDQLHAADLSQWKLCGATRRTGMTENESLSPDSGLQRRFSAVAIPSAF